MLSTQDLQALQAFSDNNDYIAYYSYLRDRGVGYATLALGVASNATSGNVVADLGGMYAINYLKEKYRQYNGTDITAEQLADVKKNLMKADLEVRERAAGAATANEIANYHYDVFVNLGIPREAWTGDTLHRRINDAVWCITCGPVELGPNAGNALQTLKTSFSDFSSKFSADEWLVFISDATLGRVAANTFLEYGKSHPFETAVAALTVGAPLFLALPGLTSAGLATLALTYLAPDEWNRGIAVGALSAIDPSLSVEDAMKLVDSTANSYFISTEVIATFNALRAQLPTFSIAEFTSSNFSERALDFIKLLKSSGATGQIFTPATAGDLAALAISSTAVRQMLHEGLPFAVEWSAASSSIVPDFKDYPTEYWFEREKLVRALVAQNVSESAQSFGDIRYLDRASGKQAIVGEGWSTEKNVIFSGNGYTGSDVKDVVFGALGEDNLFGGAGDDELYGAAGNDSMNGGAGVDRLVGGDGNDAYIVDSSSDIIIELAGEGSDTVTSSTGYTLSANVENLNLHGSSATQLFGMGNSESNTIKVLGGAGNLYGGAGADTLQGGSLADTLNGGAGSDHLFGGGGNDLLFGNDGGELDYLDGGAGMDQIFADGDLVWGGAENDQLSDTGAGSRFIWTAGDGLDVAIGLTSASVAAFTSNQGYTASRSGADLLVTGGGGVRFAGWFNGQNRATIEMPDGSTWSPAAIDKNFSSGVYDISYASGVHLAADFANVMEALLPDMSWASFSPSTTVWAGGPSITWGELWNSGVQHGGWKTDSAGQAYQSWGLSTVVSRSGSEMLTNGLWGNKNYSNQVSLQYDFWTNAEGKQVFAVTSATSPGSLTETWMTIQNDEKGNPIFGSASHWYYAPEGQRVSSVREVNVLEPAVSSFTLYSPLAAQSKALDAQVELLFTDAASELASTPSTSIGGWFDDLEAKSLASRQATAISQVIEPTHLFDYATAFAEVGDSSDLTAEAYFESTKLGLFYPSTQEFALKLAEPKPLGHLFA